ncbi:MAG TPA: hypothetical protein VIH61_06485, partial [Waddliaceae bacterium]
MLKYLFRDEFSKFAIEEGDDVYYLMIYEHLKSPKPIKGFMFESLDKAFEDAKERLDINKDQWKLAEESWNGENVTNQIALFRDFLNVVWPSLNALMAKHNWDDDGCFTDEWLQLNWEYLVERQIFGKGNGALSTFSMMDGSDRIFSHASNCVYGVIAYPKNNCDPIDVKKKIKPPFSKGLKLFSFRTYKGGAYG